MTLDTPHARFRKLKNQFCPSIAERETQLLSQYLALRKMPKRANTESWLDSWEELLELVAAAEIPELRGTRAQRNFLDSVQSTDDSWATSQRISMIAKQEMGEPFMSAAGLIVLPSRTTLLGIGPITLLLGRMFYRYNLHLHFLDVMCLRALRQLLTHLGCVYNRSM
jgi:hypothetical protein